jgi:UDP-GlcNAc:undecaprenyl-phosphate GlcNAc-1-phosphate transferase
MREYVLVLLVAAAVTYLLTPLVRRFAIATGAQHVPRDRDVHSTPTPLLGGLAMFGGLAAGLLVSQRLSYLRQAFPSGKYVWGLLLAAGVLVVVGFVDDRWGMGAITKLAGQVAAGGVLVWSGVDVSWIPTPNGGLLGFTGLQSLVITIVLVVITINAVNFVDGLDGLAAGIVAVAALSFMVYSYTLDKKIGLPSQSLAAVVSALLAGMCLGFLPHNFHPAKIFMGDTGSMLLGLLLAYGPITSLEFLDPGLLTNYSLHPLNRFPTILPLLLPVAILIIPYADLMLAVVRRTKAGKSPLAADREHLHHRLLNIGHTQRQSVIIMYLWAIVFAGLVVALSVLRTSVVWIAIVTVAAILVLLPATMPRLRPGYAKRERQAQARAERAARSVKPADPSSPAPQPPSAPQPAPRPVPQPASAPQPAPTPRPVPQPPSSPIPRSAPQPSSSPFPPLPPSPHPRPPARP